MDRNSYDIKPDSYDYDDYDDSLHSDDYERLESNSFGRHTRNIKNSYSRRNMQRKRKFKKTLFVVEIIVLGIVAFGVYFYLNLNNKLSKTKVDIDKNNLGADYKIDGYLNIALFGVDARDDELDQGTRSDTIMIVSICEKNKTINIISVYRDTFLLVPDYGDNPNNYLDDYTKVTHAYTKGPSSAIQTLNKNLDMNIENFVTINFMALVKTIDMLGGIEVEVPNKEGFVEQINKHSSVIAELNGDTYKPVEKPGRQVLNGYQALGYARVRKVAGESDFTRATRQREILNLTLQKFKSKGLTKTDDILNSITANMRTSFSTNDIISLMAKVSTYNISTSKGFPFETVTKNTSSGSSELASPSLLNNVDQLHKELFPDLEYVPSEKLKTISNHIATTYGTNTVPANQ